MPKATNSVAAKARRKKVLKAAKGYTGRKQKKRNFRSLWIQRINAGVREYGMSYSEFMGKIAKNNIELNRKALADLAMNSPEAFKAIVEKVK